MIYVVKFCFTLLFWENLAILQKEDPKIKDLKFVENLKHNLRRNNDDYLEITRPKSFPNINTTKKSLYIADNAISNNLKTNNYVRPSTPKAPLASVIARRKNDEFDYRVKIIDKIRRRVNDAFASKNSIEKEKNPQRRAAFILNRHPVNQSNVMTPNSTMLQKKIYWKQMRINQKNYKALSQIKLLPNKSYIANVRVSVPLLTTATMKSKIIKEPIQRVKKKKLEKLKKFIKKNKGLLKEFMSSNMALQTPVLPISQKHGNSLREFKNISIPELEEMMKEAAHGLKGKSLEELPNAQILDMAPAKGGRIHSMRLRNRLCHRHVLVPEGPKYNSAGRAYLPPHADVRAHEYNVTRAPRLLLPRCCNCCRKSVLGCE